VTHNDFDLSEVLEQLKGDESGDLVRLGMSSRFGPTVRITFGPTLAETATSNLRG
jgi:hypothetical protein